MAIKWGYELRAKGGQNIKSKEIVNEAAEWGLSIKAEGDSQKIADVMNAIGNKLRGSMMSITIKTSGERDHLQDMLEKVAPDIAKIGGQPILDDFPFDTDE